MKIDQVEQKIKPAQTTFNLTEEDVTDAVTQWLKNKGEQIPEGSVSIWTLDRDQSRENFIAVRIIHEVVEHAGPAQG